jgi:hypothetical protein
LSMAINSLQKQPAPAARVRMFAALAFMVL